MGSSHEAFLLLPSRVDPTLDQQSEEPSPPPPTSSVSRGQVGNLDFYLVVMWQL